MLSQRARRHQAILSCIEPFERRMLLAFTTYTAPESANGIASADFNRDGKADLVVAGEFDGVAGVLLNNGAGAFPTLTNLKAGGQPIGALAGDFNADGFADIVISNGQTNTLSFFAGNGAGGFAKAVSSTVGTAGTVGVGAVNFMASADFDGDTNPDIVVANDIDNKIQIMRNKSGGKFATITTIDVGFSAGGPIVAGDFNGDTKADIAYVKGNNPAVDVQLGDGHGAFGSVTAYNAVGGEEIDGMALGDLNKDGKLDLVTANNSLSGASKVGVFINNGNGTFKAQVEYATGGGPTSITTADLNGDGASDVVCYGDITVDTYISNGDGTLGAASSAAIPGLPGVGGSTVLTDLNGDGTPDIALSGSSALTTTGGGVSIQISPPRPFATLSANGTLTGNGTSGKDTVSIFVNAAGKLELDTNLGVQTFRLSQVKHISVTLNGGHDKLSVGAAVRGVTVAGGNGNDTIVGGDNADYLLGGAGADRLFGGAGDDICSGGGGNDRLTGDLGSDQLYGGPGNDTFIARDGVADIISGSAGVDSAQIDDVIDTATSVALLP